MFLAPNPQKNLIAFPTPPPNGGGGGGGKDKISIWPACVNFSSNLTYNSSKVLLFPLHINDIKILGKFLKGTQYENHSLNTAMDYNSSIKNAYHGLQLYALFTLTFINLTEHLRTWMFKSLFRQ
jgi:hypothetical protein